MSIQLSLNAVLSWLTLKRW